MQRQRMKASACANTGVCAQWASAGGIAPGGFSRLGGLSQLSPLDLCASLPNNALRLIPELMCKSTGRRLRTPTGEASLAALSAAFAPGSSGTRAA